MHQTDARRSAPSVRPDANVPCFLDPKPCRTDPSYALDRGDAQLDSLQLPGPVGWPPPLSSERSRSRRARGDERRASRRRAAPRLMMSRSARRARTRRRAARRARAARSRTRRPNLLARLNSSVEEVDLQLSAASVLDDPVHGLRQYLVPPSCRIPRPEPLLEVPPRELPALLDRHALERFHVAGPPPPLLDELIAREAGAPRKGRSGRLSSSSLSSRSTTTRAISRSNPLPRTCARADTRPRPGESARRGLARRPRGSRPTTGMPRYASMPSSCVASATASSGGTRPWCTIGRGRAVGVAGGRRADQEDAAPTSRRVTYTSATRFARARRCAVGRIEGAHAGSLANATIAAVEAYAAEGRRGRTGSDASDARSRLPRER